MKPEIQLAIANSLIDWGALGVVEWGQVGASHSDPVALITVPGREEKCKVTFHNELEVHRWPAVIVQARGTLFLRHDHNAAIVRIKDVYTSLQNRPSIMSWEVVFYSSKTVGTTFALNAEVA